MIDPRNPDFADVPGRDRVRNFPYAPETPDAPPLVTIVTPFFNSGALFRATADCVFSQSLQQWEWLIVNDGTTDVDSLRVLDEFRRRDPRVRVIDHGHNRGLPAARNTGFAAARSEYVFQLDADDLVEPTAVEKALWRLASQPDCAFARGYTVGFGEQHYLWRSGFRDGARFLRENVATATAMVRRSIHAAVGGYDESMRTGMEDWDFWLRCAAHGHWGDEIPEFLDWYRRRATHGDRWRDLGDSRGIASVCATLRERYPSLRESSFPSLAAIGEQRCTTLPTGIRGNRLVKSAKRLLMIVPWLRMGGADKFNLDLIEQLSRRGWEVSVVATLRSENSWLPKFAKLTPDVFSLPAFLRPPYHPAFLRYMVESRRPDVVMISNSELGYWLLPYLRSLDDPATDVAPAYVDYCHMEEERWQGGGYPAYAVRYQNLLDMNIVCSRHLRDWMARRGADATRIEVAYINVHPEVGCGRDARQSLRVRYGAGRDDMVIFYAARLCGQKRPRMLAAVLAELKKQGVAFRAWVAGDGPERSVLEADIEAAGLQSHVRLLGELDADEVRALYSAADVFFLPSEWEGIALSIYEAMASGLPVVAADVGGQRELVTAETGFLIARAPGELAEYVRCLRMLLENPGLRKTLGARARARIEAEFTLDRMGDRMDALLQRAAAISRGGVHRAPDQNHGAAEAMKAVERLLDLERFEAANRDDASVLEEIERLERSRLWRLVQRAKRNAVYRALARLRWGPEWDAADPREDPRARFSRIKSSNAYRLIQAVKASPVYKWYARRKYGPETGR